VLAEEVLDGCQHTVPVLLDLCPEWKHVNIGVALALILTSP
jgi:hypothetical protein